MRFLTSAYFLVKTTFVGESANLISSSGYPGTLVVYIVCSMGSEAVNCRSACSYYSSELVN